MDGFNTVSILFNSVNSLQNLTLVQKVFLWRINCSLFLTHVIVHVNRKSGLFL